MSRLKQLTDLWREEGLPWFREGSRKPLLRQFREARAMWRTDRYPPVQYLRSRLYRNDDRDPAGYIATGVLMKLRRALNKDVDAEAVLDKLKFRRLMDSAGLSAIRELLSIDADGRIFTADNEEVSRGEAEGLVREFDGDLFVKPVDASQGRGAFVWCRDQPIEVVFAERARLVQPILRQWPGLEKLHPASLNTVRIDTLRLGDEIHINAAILRIGNSGKPTDSSTSGGLLAPICIETGRITGPAVRVTSFDPSMRRHPRHPETGAPIEGLQLPFWSDVRQLVNRGAQLLPSLPTLGWDVAVTPDGPVLVEANNDWFLAAFQLVTPLGGTRLGQLARDYHASGSLSISRQPPSPGRAAPPSRAAD